MSNRIEKQNKELMTCHLHAYCRGDNNALTALFLPLSKELFFIAFKYVKSEQDAEDLVSDCYEKLLGFSIEARTQRFQNDKVHFKHFVILMLRNKALDFLKLKNNRSKLLHAFRALWENVSQNEIKTKEETEQLRYLLSPLSDRERELIWLDLQGYSLEDIGIKMGVSKKTISNLLYESRKKLKLIISKEQVLGN